MDTRISASKSVLAVVFFLWVFFSLAPSPSHPAQAVELDDAKLADLVKKAYIYAFEQMMAAWSFAAVVLTAIAAEGAERGGPYVSAAVFALGTAAIGGLAINRYDMAVAALIALFLLAMVRGWWEVAGIAIGLGFAMKIAPVLLLPLLLIVAPWKRGLLALACFAVAGFAPFVWFLLSGPLAATNLQDMALYHLARPLELEAVLGTPLWAASLFAGPRVEIIRAANSLALDGPGAALAASLAGPLSGIGVLVAYGLALWRRCALRTDRRLIVMPVLAVLLTFLVFAKVLSPQYLIWTLAPMALVFAGRRTLGLLLLLTTALTQTVFPIGYRAIEAQWPQGVSLLVVRNVLIIVCAALALVHLARLRAVEEPASEARHDAVGREEAADPYAPSDVPALA